jgi:hypothetical protein
LATRQPALSPVDFQAAYDAHLPFLCSTVGDNDKPSKITRYYSAAPSPTLRV